MNTRTCHAHEINIGIQCNGLGSHWHTTQTHAGCQGSAGDDALTQVAVLRSEPNTIAKGRGILHGTLQALGICNGELCLRKADTARLGQLDHGCQNLTLKTSCQST